MSAAWFLNGRPMARSRLVVAGSDPNACNFDTTAGTWPGNITRPAPAAGLEKVTRPDKAKPRPNIDKVFLIRPVKMGGTPNIAPPVIGMNLRISLVIFIPVRERVVTADRPSVCRCRK